MRPPKPADPRRSALMSRVRQRGTDAELAVASTLRRLGVTYRLNVTSLPGSPDFANRKIKLAAFVNGCFWHHHRACRRATIPKTNESFWREKFSANRARDARSIRALRREGFRVILIWECETEKESVLAERLQRLLGPALVGGKRGIADDGGLKPWLNVGNAADIR
jgi:DNA mismatch endonuclease (patch repair protein)